MAGAVHVGVVAVGGLVLDVRGVDGDAAGLFFGRVVDLVVALGFAAKLLGQHRGNRRRQRRLAMVHVTDRAHVDVGLGTLEFSFCHFSDSEKYLSQNNRISAQPEPDAPSNGAHGGNRTRDLSLTKGVLYH